MKIQITISQGEIADLIFNYLKNQHSYRSTIDNPKFLITHEAGQEEKVDLVFDVEFWDEE
jgi:hypothetical protein